MTGRKALLIPLAVLLVAAAIFAPAASAYTEPFFSGSPSRQATPATDVRVVQVPSDSGFQWGDAAIGAGGALAFGLVGLGVALAIASTRSRHAAAYRRATPSAS
jgi:hypothetical protein